MFQIEENTIVAQTEELYPFRLQQVSTDDLNVQVDVDYAVENFKCIDFPKFFEFVYENYGQGTYNLTALTHQTLNINNETVNPEEMLIGIETQCQIKFDEENFYITDTMSAMGYIYLTSLNSGYDLTTWKSIVDENTTYSDETKNAFYELIERIPGQVNSEYLNMNIIRQLPIWDRLIVSKGDAE